MCCKYLHCILTGNTSVQCMRLTSELYQFCVIHNSASKCNYKTYSAQVGWVLGRCFLKPMNFGSRSVTILGIVILLAGSKNNLVGYLPRNSQIE